MATSQWVTRRRPAGEGAGREEGTPHRTRTDGMLYSVYSIENQAHSMKERSGILATIAWTAASALLGAGEPAPSPSAPTSRLSTGS